LIKYFDYVVCKHFVRLKDNKNTSSRKFSSGSLSMM